MKLITVLTFIIYPFFSVLQASSEPSKHIKGVPEEMLLNEPSCIVNHSVNVITGNYHENATDIEVAGPHPLHYQRSYVSGITSGKLCAGWNTNHLGSVYLQGVFKRLSYMNVTGDHGAESSYLGKVPINKNDKTTHVVELDTFEKYMTNCPDFCFIPGSHIRNNRLYYQKNTRQMILTTGNGYTRHYQRKNTNKYLMEHERQPNGCILRYEIGDQKKISLENQHGNELSSLSISTSKDNSITLTGSDGKWVTYYFKNYGHDRYFLNRVKGSDVPMHTYEYSTKSAYGYPKIVRKNLPDRRFLCNEYYKSGKNQNEEKLDLNYFDPRVGRVMLQKAPVGVDATPITTHRYLYDLREEWLENVAIALGGCTTVFDAHNNKTDYYFNDDYRITDIKRWNKGNKLVYSIEKSFWAPNDSLNSTNLMSRTLENGQNEIKLCRSYVYDNNGNATQKYLWGNLTGRHAGNIILDPNGIPYPGSQEFYVKTYTYSTDFQNLLLSENDGKKTIEYSYWPNTNLIASRLVKVGNNIHKREFKAFDANGCLSTIIVDDGSGHHESYSSNITERHFTCIYCRTEAPIGLPEIIDRKYMDFDTGMQMLQGRVCNKYSPMGRLLSQEHYDSEYVLKYTLEWEYDFIGNVIKEKDALGRVIHRKYDANTNLVYEEGPIPGVSKNFTYDFANRLIGISEKHPDGVILTNSFRYDFLGNKVASIDPYGHETRYVYDHLNRLIETIYPVVLNENMDPVHPTTRVEYDLFNNPSSIIDASGGSTTIAYTAHNKPYHKTYPDGTFERFEYDTSGNLIMSVAQNGTKTIYLYDPFDRLIKKDVYSAQDVLIQTESNAYNTFHLLSNTNPQGLTTNYQYDKAGRIVTVVKGEMRTEYEYDTLGRESRVLTFFGTDKEDYSVLIKEYDLLNRVIEERIEDSLGNIQTKEIFEYDLFGNRNVIGKYNQAGESITKTEYNTRGEMVLMTDAMGEQTHIHYRYDYFDKELGQNLPCSESTDPKGIVTTCIKDALGRNKMEYKKDPFGKLIQKRTFYYTASGFLSRSVDEVIIDGVSKGEIVNICTYNTAGKLIETCESAGSPEQKVTKFTYNSSGQKQSEIKPDGIILYYHYDALGRLDEYWSSDESIHYIYEYDLNGNAIRVVDQTNGTETLKSFDEYNHLIKETLANGLSLEYTYDLSGKPTKILFPDGSGMGLSYENLFFKEIFRLSSEGEKLYTHTYDAYDLSGNVLESTLIGKAGKANYSVDVKGRMTHVIADAWTGSIQNFDKSGNVSKKTFRDELGKYSSEFNYDSLNQILEETGNFNEQYAYDSLYNRIKKGNGDYTLNPLNQITHDGKHSYEYDLNGNLIKISNDLSQIEFAYDALNRLVKVKKDSQLITYAYDEMNRRMSKTLTELDKTSEIKKTFKYFYQDLNEIGCYENDNLIELRLLGIGKGAEIGAAIAMEFNDIVYAPIHDLHGNVVCLVEANTGKIKEFYRYNAFGEEFLYDEDGNQSQGVINSWRFSSKRTDNETGFVYFGRRYYDSKLGRWITPDPIGFEGGPNLYAYVMNNPLGHIDLYGLASEDSMGATGSERGFFDNVKDFMRSTYEGIRDGIASLCFSIGEGLSRITSSLCDRFNSYREERQIVFNQRIFQSAMNRLSPTTHAVGEGSYAGLGLTNGINTALNTLLSYAEIISEAAGGIQLSCVYNPTNGLVHDICRAFHSLHFDLASNVIQNLHAKWNNHFEKYGTKMPFLQICHSEGAINVRNALMCYNKELRKMIDVLAIAPGAYIGTSLCRTVYHYVSTRDFVPWLDIRGRMNNQETTTILPAHKDANFWDHDFQSPTYNKVIRDHLEQHLKKIGL